MDLIEGEMVQEGVSIDKINFRDAMKKLVREHFSGYVNITIEGVNGFEEGTIVLRAGSLVAASYEYMKYGVIVNGDAAIPQFFNASAAKYGIIDVVSFRATDAELTIAVNPKVRVGIEVKESDVDKLMHSKFNPAYARKTLALIKKKVPSRYTVMKKIGLGAIAEGAK
ncbi:MAG: DUF2226 domain-containing protein [archaeon]